MGIVYLIPTVLHENANASLPVYILDAIRDCKALFVENERTARRFLKSLAKEIVIDDFEWHNIKEQESSMVSAFRKDISENKNVGIISEAGCPGIADPGQALVAIAQSMNAVVKPLVGPSSVLLALMASGMNGQQFQFLGYLPIEISARSQAVKKIEQESKQKDCTQIFIETPYRNNQLFETLLKTCEPKTRLCVAVDLTGPGEMVKTKKVSEWKTSVPDLHKKPAIFLLYSGQE
jgi:16S rRNA (cytidine1402-2'-O)-methyltransferase